MSDDVILTCHNPTDEDGFVTLQCPFCGDYFKINGEDSEDDSIINLYCPYCGLCNDPTEFTTEEVKQHLKQMAINYMNGKLNSMFKQWEKESRNQPIKFKSGKPLPIHQPSTLYDNHKSMSTMSLKCCNKQIKINSTINGAFCPFCGVK